MKKIIFLITIIFLLAAAQKIFASGPIIINEIVWMGTQVSYNDEWSELYNNTDSPISLDGWTLKAADETPKINLVGTISGRGFYLLERTDDNTVPNISADQIYSGALGNAGENLALYDNFGNLIDSVNCSSGWFAGDNNTKQTMERRDPQIDGNDPQNWGTSLVVNGTPRQKNSIFGILAQTTPTPTPNPTPTPTTNPSLSPTITSSPILTPTVTLLPTPSISPSPSVSPQKILVKLLINEFIPNPAGSDEENEWIEIYDAGDNEVNLNGWKIQDASGKAYTFKEEKILAKNYLVLYRPKTKITINNDAETLSLIAPQGETASQISFSGGSKEGYSFARFGPNDWRWTEILTPGKENQFSAESQQKSFAASPSPSASLKIPYTNPESLGSFKKIVLPAIAIGAIFSLAALIFIKKFIP